VPAQAPHLSGDLATELLILIAFAMVGAAVFERLRLPPIAGFLLVGALVGPGGLGLLDDPARVEALAEFGVIFLLFEIGLELPLERLQQIWRRALAAGGLQVAATLALVSALGLALGLPAPTALVLGALVAMSSTALVMRLLSEAGEIDAPQGQLAVGILLFQDLCIVPFLLAVPILAAGAAGSAVRVILELGRAALALALFFGVARFVLPPLLDRLAKLRSREVFSLAALLVVLGSALAAERLGLTLSVGAFVGGLVLSASPLSHQLFAEVVPLRGVLLGIFFTAVGMLFDPEAVWASWRGVLGYALLAIPLKLSLVAVIVAVVLRQGLRLGLLTGFALAQTGEFSFVLAAAARDAGLLGRELEQVFVAGSIGTLLATPLLLAVAPRVAIALSGLSDRSPRELIAPAGGLSHHVVLVGFGLAGRTLARVLRARGIPYAAVDANAVRVAEARRRGEPVMYGDATRRLVLERLGIRRAGLLVVAISDPLATREVVSLARRIAAPTAIVARTARVLSVDDLSRAGADFVVAEELESTIELLSETLRRFGAAEEAIARFTTAVREEGYELLRAPPGVILDPWLAELLGTGAAAPEPPKGAPGREGPP
jgi:CPA2 family monovalent cation:H+ antiporter-2